MDGEELLGELQSVTYALLCNQHGRSVAHAVMENGWQWTEGCPNVVDPRVHEALQVIAKAHGEAQDG